MDCLINQQNDNYGNRNLVPNIK